MSTAAMERSPEDVRARLRKQIEEAHPEAWVASDEDAEFVGVFRHLKMGPSKFGEVPIAILEDLQSGELRSVWLVHTVLRNEMIRAAPVDGETVMIRYLGLENPEGGGQPYRSYRVAVDRERPRSMDWRELDPDPDEPQPEVDPEAVDADGDDIPF